jgi:hypothetical protein
MIMGNRRSGLTTSNLYAAAAACHAFLDQGKGPPSSPFRALSASNLALTSHQYFRLFSSGDPDLIAHALMNLYTTIQLIPESHRSLWNFVNVLGDCDTIEFRRPSVVNTAANTKHWVAIALGYMANAIAL